ncbi:hypothetical protein N9L26_02125 [Candidatus Pacebacteria bacterium]|nr:hypothetical protein [Candidatus Paceibacterota bacterium]
MKKVLMTAAAVSLVAVAGCAPNDYASDDGRLVMVTGVVTGDGINGLDTTATLIDFKPMENGVVTAARSHLEVGQTTPVFRDVLVGVTSGMGAAAVAGGFGLAASKASACGDNCGTYIDNGSIAVSGSQSAAAADANAKATNGSSKGKKY